MRQIISYFAMICMLALAASVTTSCNSKEDEPAAPPKIIDGDRFDYTDCVFEGRDLLLEIPASPNRLYTRHYNNLTVDVEFYWATCEDLFADNFNPDVVSRTENRFHEEAIRVTPHHQVELYHPGDVLASWVYDTNPDIFSGLEKSGVRFIDNPYENGTYIEPGHGDWIILGIDRISRTLYFRAYENTTGKDRIMCFCFYAPKSIWGTEFVNNVIKVVQKGE